MKESEDYVMYKIERILRECEHEGSYRGNGHHLCQKTCTLLWDEFKQYLGNGND